MISASVNINISYYSVDNALLKPYKWHQSLIYTVDQTVNSKILNLKGNNIMDWSLLYQDSR